MGREYCNMSEELLGETYCGFYDFGYAKCHEVKTCPEGLDDNEDEEDY